MPYLTEKGGLIEPKIQEIIDKVTQAGPCAVATATTLWSDIAGVTQPWLAKLVEDFPGLIRFALAERGQLLARAAEEVRKLGEKIKLSPKEEDAQKGYRELSYTPARGQQVFLLAPSAGGGWPAAGLFLPCGPRIGVFGYDPEPVFGGRLQAQCASLLPGRLFILAGGDGGWAA